MSESTQFMIINSEPIPSNGYKFVIPVLDGSTTLLKRPKHSATASESSEIVLIDSTAAVKSSKR